MSIQIPLHIERPVLSADPVNQMATFRWVRWWLRVAYYNLWYLVASLVLIISYGHLEISCTVW